MARGRFTQHSRAYYARTVPLTDRLAVDEVAFTLDEPAGASGEMLMVWMNIRDAQPPFPCLHVYDDAWHALAALPDLVASLDERDGQSMTPAQFCDLLTRLGFVDETPTTREGR